MIASVRGTVVVRRPGQVVVECAGVGYRLAVSAETFKQVPAAGSEVALHSQLLLREEGIHLYGFATEEELDLFALLTQVQGVGPKVALAVLSGGTTRELLRAIAAGDSARFQAVPGIGKRTAERVIVELREKVGDGLGLGGDGLADGLAGAQPDDPRAIARQGLLGLGFATAEADDLLDAAGGDTPEELIAEALKGAR